MNNLKRILSLALASVMVMGMMVVGASATDYVDDEKIVNKEAVETLGALGIMNGDERGFRPEDGLTRAEAAKMLATIHNKGVAVNFGTKATPTFTDIKGHWAEGNIEYAAAFGIANGKGNGIFDPQGSLRVVELARMTLNMMGIEEGKTGSDWELLTTVAASNNGLLDGLDSVNPAANVTRDQAAQILVNAINAPMASGNTTQRTIFTLALVKPEDATPVQKTLVDMEFDSSTDVILVAQAYGLSAGEYTIKKETKTDSETLGTKYLSLQTNNSGVIAKVVADTKGTYTVTMTNGTEYTKVKTDYSDLMGQKVNVLYKSSNSVYGMTAIGTVVYEGTVGGYVIADNDKDKDAIEGATIYDFNNFAADETNTIKTNDLTPEQSLKVIKNGNKSYVAVTLPQVVGEVTNVTSKNASVKVDNKTTTYEIGKKIEMNGAAKGDIVIVTDAANTVSGKTELALAEITEGVAADAFRTVGKANQVRINGTWTTVIDAEDFAELKEMKKNTTYDLVMVNGYVVSQSVSVSTSEPQDLLVLTAKATTATGGLESYLEARAYFVKDGTTAVIKLKSDDKTSAAGNLYAYTEKNGIYTLTAPTAKALGYTGEIKAQGVDTKNQINGTLIDENAQVIVLLKDGKVEVVNGKAARAWAIETAFGATNAIAFTKAVNGVNYVQFAFLTDTDAESLPGAGASGKDFGYIVSNPYTSSKGVEYTMWDGEKEVEVVDKAEKANELKKGDFIEYKTGDGFISSTKLTLTADAVRGWNTTDKVLSLEEAKNVVIDDKTVYIYINNETGKGVATGALAQADADEEVDGKYIANVKYLLNTTDKTHVDVLVIDETNDMGVSVGKETKPEPTCDHDTLVGQKDKDYTAAVTADCTKGGNVEYWTCPVCKKNLDSSKNEVTKTATEKDAANHTNMKWVEVGTQENITGTAGQHVQYCDGCKTPTGTAHDANAEASVYGDCDLTHTS